MMQICKEKVAKYAIICIILNFKKCVFFFKKPILLPKENSKYFIKNKKKIENIHCYILNQSTTFRKLKKENTNKKKLKSSINILDHLKLLSKNNR